ncbi:C1 family peptidase [Labedaea rhizosphaerae]|uniref:Papain like protease n=1 Tax=Labedaea rhizosphaerae TaxID=598644 RepID=A0A4R6SHU0_LABRH|nr:C1 family peptidase [Labedaea rhizosphaerae]TDQ00518.1 papain like protease [Labedaea rhizosphaerae]
MKIKKTSVGAALLVAAIVPLALGAGQASAHQAPAAVPQAAPVKHGMGLDLAGLRAAKKNHAVKAVDTAQAPRPRLGAAPSSYDLSQYALSPGDQGQVGSCVTWATGYTGIGLLMHEQGISGSPMAPMYIYSQIAKGVDRGTWASVALPMEQQQGIDTKADYWQGDFDYTTQPDAAERANAAHYKISGYTELPTSGGSTTKNAIMNAISQGEPVAIGFQVHQSFMSLNSTTAANYTYLPGGRRDKIVGGHEVTIVSYNASGVRIENSWGTSWGAGGFFTVPWSFFDTGDVNEIHAIGKLVQQ